MGGCGEEGGDQRGMIAARCGRQIGVAPDKVVKLLSENTIPRELCRLFY